MLITGLQRKLLKYAGIFPAISKVLLECPLSINGLIYDQIEESSAKKGVFQDYFVNKNVMDQKNN